MGFLDANSHTSYIFNGIGRRAAYNRNISKELSRTASELINATSNRKRQLSQSSENNGNYTEDDDAPPPSNQQQQKRMDQENQNESVHINKKQKKLLQSKYQAVREAIEKVEENQRILDIKMKYKIKASYLLDPKKAMSENDKKTRLSQISTHDRAILKKLRQNATQPTLKIRHHTTNAHRDSHESHNHTKPHRTTQLGRSHPDIPNISSNHIKSNPKKHSPLELLPTEVLELIFLYSHNFELPLVSKNIYHKLSKNADHGQSVASAEFSGQGLYLKMLHYLSVPVKHYKIDKSEDLPVFIPFLESNDHNYNDYSYQQNHDIINSHIPSLQFSNRLPATNLKKGKEDLTDNDNLLIHSTKLNRKLQKLKKSRRVLRAASVNILNRKFVTAELLAMAGIKYFIAPKPNKPSKKSSLNSHNNSSLDVEIHKLSSNRARQLPNTSLEIPKILLHRSVIKSFQKNSQGQQVQNQFKCINNRKLDILNYILNFKVYTRHLNRAVIDNEISEPTPAPEEIANNDENSNEINNNNNNNNDNVNEREVSQTPIPETSSSTLDNAHISTLKHYHESFSTLVLVSAIRQNNMRILESFSKMIIHVPIKSEQNPDDEEVNLEQQQNNNENEIPATQEILNNDNNNTTNNDTNNDSDTVEGNDNVIDGQSEQQFNTYHLIHANVTTLLLAMQQFAADYYTTITDERLQAIRNVLDMSSSDVRNSDEIWKWILAKENRSPIRDLVFHAGGKPSLGAISSQTRRF